MDMLRRIAIAIALALLPTALAHAQSTWPDRPIKLVVHVAAGGGVDLMARVLADKLSQQMSQRVLIENMGGGGGAIAARTVAKADPDGYTFLFVGPGHAAVPFMHKQPPYDPINDFIPVSLVTQFPLVVVINPNLPAKNLAEFIALLKKEPGKHTFGSSGIGGSSHIPVEMLMHMANVKMTHVPFRGNGPSSAALIGGQIDLIIDGLAPQLGNIAENRVRVLGVTTKERTPFLPDAPAVSETLPGYQFPMWVGLFAPAKTPRDIVERMSAEIAKAVRDPTTKQRYTEVKVDAVGSTPEEFDKFFREQLKFNEDIIKRANIQQD
ncbi:TTT family tricarboxylate transporter, receptor protein [Rhodoplanes sp. Z2-YC6860]|nr:TTT family tricarboxylate transporter, receptor protein [Rhodoplanes sp. Z2-YC6860]